MKVVSVQNKIPFITRIGDFLFEKAVDGALYTVGGVCVLSDWAENNRKDLLTARVLDKSFGCIGKCCGWGFKKLGWDKDFKDFPE